MNAEQREKVIAAIKADAEIRYEYFNDEGQCCVIGGLIKAAGYELTLVSAGVFPIQRLVNELPKVCQFLNDSYGLSRDDLSVLQTINDINNLRAERQEALIEYVMSIPLTD